MNTNKFICKEYHYHLNDRLYPAFSWLPDMSREHLAQLFYKLGYKLGAEIGVRAGAFSDVLLKSNPDLVLYCIDPWTQYGGVRQDKQDRYYSRAIQLLLPHGDRVKFVRKTSMDALQDIEDGVLDFVYLDGLHDFDSVMMDIIYWSKKVRSGGIVSGHDFFYKYNTGIIQAVTVYTYAHSIVPWYRTNDAIPSFFWVKEIK